MSRAETTNRIKQVGIIPTIRTADALSGKRAAEAICRGGICIIEISLSVPNAIVALQAISRAHGDRMVVGAGTVLDGDAAKEAIGAGAQFIVTSGFNLSAVEEAIRSDVAVFAGALTPTEIQNAQASGADAVKLFPCYAVGGARYLKAMRGQYPQVDFIASGGVSVDNCGEYFQAGASAIGVGGEIADADSMVHGDHRVFSERAKRFVKAVQQAQARWVTIPA